MLIAIVCILVFASCSTVQTITVYGRPGDNIYTPQKEYLATVQDSGQTEIKLSAKSYYAFLYTHSDDSDLWIPFALNIRYNNHSGARTAYYTGMTIAYIGAFVTGLGGGMSDHKIDGATPTLIGGLAGFTAGAFLSVPAANRMYQLHYQYNFSYKDSQNTNSDIPLSRPTTPSGN